MNDKFIVCHECRLRRPRATASPDYDELPKGFIHSAADHRLYASLEDYKAGRPIRDSHR